MAKIKAMTKLATLALTATLFAAPGAMAQVDVEVRPGVDLRDGGRGVDMNDDVDARTRDAVKEAPSAKATASATDAFKDAAGSSRTIRPDTEDSTIRAQDGVQTNLGIQTLLPPPTNYTQNEDDASCTINLPFKLAQKSGVPEARVRQLLVGTLRAEGLCGQKVTSYSDAADRHLVEAGDEAEKEGYSPSVEFAKKETLVEAGLDKTFKKDNVTLTIADEKDRADGLLQGECQFFQ